MRCCCRFLRDEAGFFRQEVRRKRTQRRDVVDNPDPASVGSEHEIIRLRLDGEIAHRHGRETAALELGPRLPAVDRDIESKLRSKEEQIRLHEVFLDHMRIAANAFHILRSDQRLPCLAIVSCLVEIGRKVAKGMAIERGVGCAGIEVARLHPADPGVLWQAWERCRPRCSRSWLRRA